MFSNAARTATAEKNVLKNAWRRAAPFRDRSATGHLFGAPWEFAAAAAVAAIPLFRVRRAIRPRRDRNITGEFSKGEGGTLFARADARARARARAPRRTLCSPDIDRWIAAIHHRSPDSPATPTRPQRPRDTYPSTPLSRDSHLASRTSASPGRVSFSGHGGARLGGAG